MLKDLLPPESFEQESSSGHRRINLAEASNVVYAGLTTAISTNGISSRGVIIRVLIDRKICRARSLDTGEKGNCCKNCA